MPPSLELRAVSKRFGSHWAVRGVSLAVPQGAFYSLLGPSGCGKTTTLRLVAGFEEPEAGEVLLAGRRLNGRPPYERNVSTVFQNYALFPHLTVRRNIEFGLRHNGRLARAEVERRVAGVIELVQLAGKEDRRPHEISGGERQRVALARSLVVEPGVLLLDEPLSALDPALRRQVRGELKALQRRVGITFLLVTHDQEEALSLSDTIAVMRAGAIEQAGPPEDLYLRPRTRFVASFLGSVNWIGAAGIRPEATRLSRQDPGDGVRSVEATIASALFLGHCIRVEARLPTGETVAAEVPREEAAYRPGDRVHVWWRPAEELCFEE